MIKYLAIFLLFILVGCVEEIPVDQLEQETFGESSGVVTPAPTPNPPVVEVPTVKTPQILQVLPNNSEFIAGTTNVEISAITDIQSNCRFHEALQGFATMTPMTQTNGVQHKQMISGLKDGDSKKIYIKCAQKNDSTEGFTYTELNFSIAKSMVGNPNIEPPTPEITSLTFMGGIYYLSWKIDTTTILGNPDGGFDTILDGVDLADRTGAISFSRQYANLDYKVRHCFKIEARFHELTPTRGMVSPESCIDPQVEVDTKAPVILSSGPKGVNYPQGSTGATLVATTDENAECRYSVSSVLGYDSMSPMGTTGAKSHSHALAGLPAGSHQYTIRCSDTSKNISNPSSLSFTLPQAKASLAELRVSVRNIFDKGCISCHGQGKSVQSRADLARTMLDIEKDTRLIKAQNPDESVLYIAITIGGMTGYLNSQDKVVIREWIQALAPSEGDTTPPVITSFAPNGAVYDAGTMNTDFTVTTNENASCAFSTSILNLDFSKMTSFSTTGGMSHSYKAQNLQAGNFSYFVKCSDTKNNISDHKEINFSIKDATPAPGPTKEELRASVRQIINNNCISCHGNQEQYQSVIDLAVDLRVLEKNSKYIKFKDPQNSFLYQKISTGSMAKYIQTALERKTIFDWISVVDGSEVIALNCPEGEEAIDNVCVKNGKVLRSYGYRMVTPEEMFKDINSIWNVNLTNKDPNSGQPIVPEPQTNYGFDNQFGLVSANSVYINSIEEVANMLGEALNKKADFEPNNVSCMADTMVNCGMALTNVYIPKVFRRVLTPEELAIYRDFFTTATGSKKEVYIKFFKALVQSPSFLFREEHGTGGIATGDTGGDANQPMVTELILMDASNNQIIQSIPLNSSVIVNTAAAGTQLSLEAKGSNIQSMIFKAKDHSQTESAAPYMFSGDDGTNLYPWTLTAGKHLIEITPYSEKAGAGTAGTKVILNLELVSKAGTTKVEVLPSPDSMFNLDAFEVASRMSYFITGGTPDATLRAKAKDGTILQKSVREAEARRLMQLSHAQQHLAETFMESIGIKKLAHTESLSRAMIQETRTLIRQIFFSDKKWTDVFTANYTYVNKTLADIYDISTTTDENNFIKVNYPNDQRSGILSHASYLSAFFDGKDKALTKDMRRGINFYEKILCKNMPLPPADVDVDLDPAKDLQGCRLEKRKQTTSDPSGTCFQCHQHFDPIGAGFDRFNNLGEYRTVQEDDSSCSTIEDFYLEAGQQFSTMENFTKAVSENDQVGRCLAVKMKTYAYGSSLETSYLKEIYLEMDKFKSSMNFKDLIIDIVSNDQFIKRESRDEN